MAIVLDLKAQREKYAQDFMSQVQSTMLFTMDWSPLLGAAPVSLSIMGSCYIAASSAEVAIDIEKSKPRDGFKYLGCVNPPPLHPISLIRLLP